MKQMEIINRFCASAKFYLVKYEGEDDIKFGKILTGEEILKVDLTKHEIYRSIAYKDGDRLFVHSLKPKDMGARIDNPLQLLKNNLEEAKIIELVYPDIFSWVFDGISIKAYAVIPSGQIKAQSTISRYGGTEMFIKILRQHLDNIGKMSRGFTPDYNFLKDNSEVEELELSLGSINLFNNMHSINVDLTDNYITVLKKSENNTQTWRPLTSLNMKYWAREINPDFITEAKHIKLKKTLEVDTEFKLFPPCVKNLMALKHKGNFNRYLLSRFLLSVHNPTDAKFIYNSVMGEEEREHLKTGDCATQFSYIANNIKRYESPTCKEMRTFCDRTCTRTHPLEDIEKHFEEEEKQNEEK